MNLPARTLAVACSLALCQLAAPSAPAADSGLRLIGLTADDTLVLFTPERPGQVRTVKVTKISGTLVGIDYRPANGRLYGLSTANNLYTIDPTTGAASTVATLTVPFEGGSRSGFDFNPQSDRLRLVGGRGQNLRVHPEIGAAATDGSLAYAAKDRNSRRTPVVAACAYTNSVHHATNTKTFDIDATLDVLVLQEPPNDGVLTTVGPLGVDFDEAAGFDIVTDEEGNDRAFAASGSALYSIDLETGKATRLGAIGQGTWRLVGLAAVPASP